MLNFYSLLSNEIHSRVNVINLASLNHNWTLQAWAINRNNFSFTWPWPMSWARWKNIRQSNCSTIDYFANRKYFCLICKSLQNNYPFPHEIGFMPYDNVLNPFCLAYFYKLFSPSVVFRKLLSMSGLLIACRQTII